MNRLQKKDNFKKLMAYRKQLFEEPVLQQVAIETTLACNCRCLHCGSLCGDTPPVTPLSDTEILDCLRTLKEDLSAEGKKLPFVFITGGEPLLRRGTPELMYQVKKLGYSWGMTTNGILIDREMAKDLKAAGIYSVGISLDGLEETHDWFRRKEGSYGKALQGAAHMIEEHTSHVMITTVVHKKNLTELPALYEVVRSLGANLWRVINLEPIGRALSYPELMLEPEDYGFLLDFIREKNGPELPVQFGCNHFLGYDLEYEVRPWLFFCQSGLRILSIECDGSITGCLDIRRGDAKAGEMIHQGNIREDRLYEVWKNRFQLFRRPKAESSGKCSGCRYLPECDGGGFHTWDFEGEKPLLCMPEMLGLL